MNRPRRIAGLLILLMPALAWAAPPRVVQTTPENGASDVDPNTAQITVVFDQAMNHGGRSIVGGGPNFPKIEGEIRWSDDRTIVIPVKLESDHDYRLSINNYRFKNFQNTSGEPAIPYPIAFSTGGAAKIAPEVQKESIAALRKAIDENYSYRDLRKVDWDKLFADNADKLEQCETAKAFARAAGDMLAVAQDIHMTLRVGDSGFATARRSVPANANYQTLPKLVPNWKQHEPGRVVTGRFDDGATYLMIPSWSRDAADELDPIFEAIAGADPKAGMIIDVRPNSGGSEPLAMQVAGCFLAEPKVYSKHTTISGGKWRGPIDRVIKPNKSRPAYRGKVAVLIGRHCMSSNESFILMMKVAGATLVGEQTYGSSGNPRPHNLPNGVTILLPSWKDLLPDGSLLEGVGIKPDIELKTQPADFEQRDPVLEAGLKALRS